MIETCDECWFDGGRWSDRDAVGSLRAVAPMFGFVIDDVDDAVLHRRPTPEVWSMAEYADHVRETLFGMRFLLDSAVQSSGADLGDSPTPVVTDEPRSIDVVGTLAAMDAEALALQASARALLDADGAFGAETAAVVVDGDEVDVSWIVRHALHDSFHHLHDIGRLRHRFGAGAATQTGSVAHLHVSDGGVPKQPIDSVEVSWSGVLGDRQNDRQNHGRPFQALCLWSVETIDALRSEGHPIEPGFAGENVTMVGVDWSALRPGDVLRVGGVLAELSSYAVPCAKNAGWFVDGDFTRMHHDLHPGWSRLYAWVRQPGRIAVGDPVVIEP